MCNCRIQRDGYGKHGPTNKYHKGLPIPPQENFTPSTFAMCHVHIRHDPLVSHVQSTFQHMERMN